MGWPAPNTFTGAFLWNSCTIGDMALPPDATLGAAVIKVTSKQKLDQATASGKNKAKTTQKGTDPCPVDIEVRFHANSWSAMETILATIDPNGPSKGGPFTFSYPDAERRGVKWIMVEEVGEVEWRGHSGTVKIGAKEWEEPKKAIAGGVRRATTPGGQGGPIQLTLLQDQLASLDAQIADTDSQIRNIDSATDRGEAPNVSKLARLQAQRAELANKRASTSSAIQDTLHDGLNNTSDTPDRAKSGASQTTAAGQKPTKQPKPDPFAAATGPNSNP